MKTDHFLFINTSETDKAEIALFSTSKTTKKVLLVKRNLSERLLSQIHRLFSNKLEFSELKGIAVVTGPGSFTGIRVGVATANALAYAGNTPVLGIPKNEVPDDLRKIVKFKFKKGLVSPFYDKLPHITKPKQKF